MRVTFWQALSEVGNERRREYFQWIHGIQNLKVDYGSLTEEEFIERQSSKHRKITNPDQFMNYLKRWESSPEYKRLLMLYKEDKFAEDILNVYDAVLEKASKEPDNATIKSLISLQDQISKYRKSIDRLEELEDAEEDEGLDLII